MPFRRSVRPSVRSYQGGPDWRDFDKIWYWGTLNCQENPNFVTIGQNFGYFTWRPKLDLFFRRRNFAKKSCCATFNIFTLLWVTCCSTIHTKSNVAFSLQQWLSEQDKTLHYTFIANPVAWGFAGGWGSVLRGPPGSRGGGILGGKINILNETRQVTYIRNNEALSCIHCCSGISVTITLCCALINCFMCLSFSFCVRFHVLNVLFSILCVNFLYTFVYFSPHVYNCLFSICV
jgi:hypothetical protein